MNSAIHFLETNGILSAVLKWVVLGLLGWLVKLVKTHVAQQKKIADRLNTETPGGLADVVDAVRDSAQK